MVRGQGRKTRRPDVVRTAALLMVAASIVARSHSFLNMPAQGARLSDCRRPVGTGWTQRYATAAAPDTFDPWTVLEISPGSSEAEAKKVYKKMIAKYHPDRDPSPEASVIFEKVVRAYAIISGEDKKLDQATLLKNAIENLRDDVEFKRKQIEDLKAQAAAAEQDLEVMQERMVETESQRNELTKELGAIGGAALGLGVLGPAGLLVGGVLGIVVKDRDDVSGQVVRGTGQVVKGLWNAVAGAAEKAEEKEGSKK